MPSEKKKVKAVKCWAIATERGRIIDVRRSRSEARAWTSFNDWQVIPGTFTPITPKKGAPKRGK